MATSSLDIQSAVDRVMNVAGRGDILGFPFLPGLTSNATTGVPTNGTQGWAPGAIFHNVKATSPGTMFYINTGTFASSIWLNVDGSLAAIASAVLGVAAGYKIARGTVALDGSNPTDVVTGLTTIVSATVTVVIATSTVLSTSMVTYTASGGTLSIYAWKPTANNDTTLTASDGTQTVSWIAVGT